MVISGDWLWLDGWFEFLKILCIIIVKLNNKVGGKFSHVYEANISGTAKGW